MIQEEVVGPFCPWHPSWAGLGIPEFLVFTQAERKAAWTNVPVTRQGSDQTEEEWQVKQRFYREAYETEKKQKNATALEGLKAKHAGERYDRKLRQWVPEVTATVKDDHEQDRRGANGN